MLKNNTRLAKHVICPRHKNVYKMHMCGLCAGLGERYGLLSRLLVEHDLVVLNMLVGIQLEKAEKIVVRCPLNPFIKVPANTGIATAYSASVAVELAALQAEDDIQDTNRRRAKRKLRRLKSARSKAKAHLKQIGLGEQMLRDIVKEQTDVEAHGRREEAGRASMNYCGDLFAAAGHLAGHPENVDTLRKIGRNYGAAVYLVDALYDYPKDIVRKQYNPLTKIETEPKKLSRFVNKGLLPIAILPVETQIEVFKRLQSLTRRISSDLDDLNLGQDKEVLRQIMLAPFISVLQKLKSRVEKNRDVIFIRLRAREIILLSLFISTVVMIEFNLVELIYTASEEWLSDTFARDRGGSCLAGGGDCTYCSNALDNCSAGFEDCSSCSDCFDCTCTVCSEGFNCCGSGDPVGYCSDCGSCGSDCDCSGANC